jgi:hypothetical protein
MLNVASYAVTVLLNTIVRESLITAKKHVHTITAINLDT